MEMEYFQSQILLISLTDILLWGISALKFDYYVFSYF